MEQEEQVIPPRGLTTLTLRGFKTIRNLVDFHPGAISVLIGPNGAGKSNLISFFRFLSWALATPGQLQEHIARLGGASAILRDGPETTREIEAVLRFETDSGASEYSFRLAYAAGDTLIFTDERYRYKPHGTMTFQAWKTLGVGHKEPALIAAAEAGYQTASTIMFLARKMVIHQFHNTSDTARIRQKWNTNEDRWLKEDAGNLAPFLLRLQRNRPEYYTRIIETIRQVLPFFAEFVLEPEYERVLLSWREIGSDHVFSASQAADGMLRALALIALLQQPEEDLPKVLILDEPELGLHPYAVEVLAGLLRAASKYVQVVVATQSVSLINGFSPEDIVVVDRHGRESSFQRLSSAKLGEWLDEYSLSELWEKNIIGGRPSR
ncbi:MAG: AAA family ATPase [Bryobacteraceae bacterium]|nr:AAA family ATPase [Bryobacteraceae bacterium]